MENLEHIIFQYDWQKFLCIEFFWSNIMKLLQNLIFFSIFLGIQTWLELGYYCIRIQQVCNRISKVCTRIQWVRIRTLQFCTRIHQYLYRNATILTIMDQKFSFYFVQIYIHQNSYSFNDLKLITKQRTLQFFYNFT